MNDPHVNRLHYRIKHSDSVDFDQAPPIEYEIDSCSVRIEKNKAEVTMNEHYATADAARSAVEPLLRAWELKAALFDANDNFKFEYQNADIIDRMPSPGVRGSVGVSMAASLTATAQSHANAENILSPLTI